MARTGGRVRISLSVLDRLIDDGAGSQLSDFSSLRLFKEAVQRDLANLLNSRRDIIELPPDLPEVKKSIASYGIPDFSTASVDSLADRNRILRAVEEAVSLFEPRLENVTVEVVPVDEKERMLRFRLDGRLRIDPEPEPVTFDAALHLSTSTFSIRE